VENLLARVKVRWWLFIVGRKRKHEQCAEALEVLHKVIAAQPFLGTIGRFVAGKPVIDSRDSPASQALSHFRLKR